MKPSNLSSLFSGQSTPAHDEIHLWISNNDNIVYMVRNIHDIISDKLENRYGYVKNFRPINQMKWTRTTPLLEQPVFGYNNFLIGKIDAIIDLHIIELNGKTHYDYPARQRVPSHYKGKNGTHSDTSRTWVGGYYTHEDNLKCDCEYVPTYYHKENSSEKCPGRTKYTSNDFYSHHNSIKRERCSCVEVASHYKKKDGTKCVNRKYIESYYSHPDNTECKCEYVYEYYKDVISQAPIDMNLKLIVEIKPKMESVSSMMGQIKSYDGLMQDKKGYENRILVILTTDESTKFDDMLKQQDIHVVHIPGLKMVGG